MRQRLRDVPKKETRGLPVPAVGRFCLRDREGPPDYPEFGIAWTNADGDEVFARLGREDQRVAWCKAGFGPWLPTDWRMTASPYGWTFEHLRPWFSIVKNWCNIPFSKRHDINTTPENESPDFPSPRRLVHHAYLILRHLTHLHGWEGTPEEPIGLKNEDTFGCVSQLQIVEAAIEKRLPKSVATTEVAGAQRRSSPVGAATPFDYLAEAQAERERQEADKQVQLAIAEKNKRFEKAHRKFGDTIHDHIDRTDQARFLGNPDPVWRPEPIADLLLEIGVTLLEEPLASNLLNVDRESLLGNWNGREDRIELECALDLLKAAKDGSRERLIKILGDVEQFDLWKALQWIQNSRLLDSLRVSPPEYPNIEFPLVGERHGAAFPDGCWLSAEFAKSWSSVWYPTEQKIESMKQFVDVSRQMEERARQQRQFEIANGFEASRTHDLSLVSRMQAQTLIPFVASRYMAAPPGTPSEIKAAFEAIAEALVDASEIRRDPSAIEPSFRETARDFADVVHKAEAAYALATIPLQACLESAAEKCPHEIALEVLRNLNDRVGHVMLGSVPFELADFHVRSMPAFDVNELLSAMRRQVCKAAMQTGERPKPDNGNPADQSASHSPDFTSVAWFGTSYRFAKGQQTEAIRLLWTAWKSSTPTISEKTIGEQAGSSSDDFKLSKLFRVTNADGKKTPHPAFGSMIQSAGKGVFQLVGPAKP